jgi:hypothetical protein
MFLHDEAFVEHMENHTESLRENKIRNITLLTNKKRLSQ